MHARWRSPSLTGDSGCAGKLYALYTVDTAQLQGYLFTSTSALYWPRHLALPFGLDVAVFAVSTTKSHTLSDPAPPLLTQ